MSRSLRRPLGVLCLLSLLAGVALAAWWLRSDSTGDVLIYSRPGGRYHRLLSIRSVLSWETAPNCPYPDAGLRCHSFPRGSFYWEPPKTVGSDGRVWSATPYAGEQPQMPTAGLEVPHGVLAAAAVAPPLAWAVWRARGRARRRKRLAAGRCPACGYDLRASPDAGGARLGRCPECGAVPPADGAP